MGTPGWACRHKQSASCDTVSGRSSGRADVRHRWPHRFAHCCLVEFRPGTAILAVQSQYDKLMFGVLLVGTTL